MACSVKWGRNINKYEAKLKAKKKKKKKKRDKENDLMMTTKRMAP